MKHEIYSHSRLASFEDCPKKFQYRYVLRVPAETESIEGFAGKRVHEVLERLYLFTTSGKVPSLARVLERFRIWWDEHYDPQRVRIVRSENDAAHYRQLGKRLLDELRQHVGGRLPRFGRVGRQPLAFIGLDAPEVRNIDATFFREGRCGR